ncbi:RICIN domain-containing protein [Streptomyces sp. HUAS ZL42]|uniref:RICIN domain-containing protein n=1 Tax=Streptomyces sp. HUAS ZL42 TaxID=3231715 RepID=UPI00345EF063
MNRGEEVARPTAGDTRPLSGEPAGLGLRGPTGEDYGPSPLPVIISGDGSAEIDGVPVPVVPGESVDVAVLDTLHGYARSRDAPVTAAISDPSAGYVAIVEVAPDGSSRLLGQHHEQEPTGPAEPGRRDEHAKPAGPFEAPRPFDVDEDDEDEVAALPQPAGPRVPSPALGPDPDRESGRRKGLTQSDDEYEGPGLLHRPLVVGTVGVAVAALVIGTLVALGTGGSGDGQNQSAGAGNDADKSPMNLQPVPSHSPSVWQPPSASPSAPKPASPSASPKPKPKTPKSESTPTPTPTRKPTQNAPGMPGDPGIPTGVVLIKNKKYGFCVDLPGTGEGKPDGTVQDGVCKAASGDNQRWILDLASRGGGTHGADLYLIRNAKDDLCFDLPNYGPVQARTPVTEYHCDGTDNDNQLWWFDKRPDGTYWIRNQKSGDMCLDVARTDKETAHAIATVYGCNDLDDHQWSFVKT